MTGIFLVALGGYFLLHQLDLIEGSIFFDGWWAWLIVFAGVAQMVEARRPGDLGSGLTISLIGVWLYLAVTQSHGLTFHNTWPLIFVAIGAGMLVKSIAQALRGDGGGSRRDRIGNPGGEAEEEVRRD